MKADQIVEKFEVIPTPIPLLNEILAGGVPTKLITEIAGPPGVGKSTLGLQILAQAQRLGRPTYYADAERAVEFVKFATAIGVDCSQLEYDKQDFAEDLLENVRKWVDENKRGVIVVDAIGALLARAEAEKSMEGAVIGVQSKMIAKFCRVLAPYLDKNNHALIVINHVYTDMGTGALKSSGGQKLDYHKGLAVWLKPTYGKAPKRSADGTKTVKFVDAEIRNKAKYPLAVDGRKVTMEFIQKQGFVGEYVQAPEKKKSGRPAKASPQIKE